MEKKRLIVLVLIICLCFPLLTFAETIILKLKSGKSVEGRLIEKTDKYIKIDFQGVSLTYFLDEIESIDGEKSASLLPGIEKYKELIRNAPDNYENYLSLAGAYGSIGDGNSAVEYAEKAIKLNPEKAINEGAYMIAAMGSYYAGKPRQSYEYVEKALQANPNDEPAQSFKKMLDTLIENQRGEKLPEKVSFGGYDSARELGEALLAREGKAILGDKEDKFISTTICFRLSSPDGWHKKADIKTPGGSHVLFLYNKFKDRKLPMIAVMKDDPYPNDKTAIDFALKSKKMFIENPPTPNMSIQGPDQVTVKGRVAAQMVMKDASANMYLKWYQFLEKDTIITFQHIDSLKEFDKNRHIFEELINSIVFE